MANIILDEIPKSYYTQRLNRGVSARCYVTDSGDVFKKYYQQIGYVNMLRLLSEFKSDMFVFPRDLVFLRELKDENFVGYLMRFAQGQRFDSLDENINITKRVVEYAKRFNVSVEAEIGHIGGTEDGRTKEIKYADPEECIRFCRETNIDCLAPALGSVHGPYIGDPVLEFNLMQEIGNSCDIPLVLHGGSGIYDEQIIKAIDCGICKININTELQQVWSKAVREKLELDKNLYDPRKIIKSGEENIKNVIKEKVSLFGTYKCVKSQEIL